MIGQPLFLLVLVLCMLCLFRLRRQFPAPLFFMAGDGDEDIKIAGAHISGFPDRDPAEEGARVFLRHKDAGNIEKARALGSAFAQALADIAKSSPFGEMARIEAEIHHQLLLCTYIVNQVISEHAPDSILAQTSLQVFYKELEEQSPPITQHVNDIAAFSLYVLWERGKTRDEREIGSIYARLCGDENNADLVERGRTLYRSFYDACSRTIRHAAYVEI